MRSVENDVVDAVALPSFDLDYGFDDEEEPATVTVYDPDPDRITASWITMDVQWAVSLDDVA